MYEVLSDSFLRNAKYRPTAANILLRFSGAFEAFARVSGDATASAECLKEASDNFHNSIPPLLDFAESRHLQVPSLVALSSKTCHWSDVRKSAMDEIAVIAKRIDDEAENAKHGALISQDRGPVGQNARMLLEKLLSLKEHEAMIGKQILDWFSGEKQKYLDQKQLGGIIKELKPYGIMNQPRKGYYIPLSARPK